MQFYAMLVIFRVFGDIVLCSLSSPHWAFLFNASMAPCALSSKVLLAKGTVRQNEFSMKRNSAPHFSPLLQIKMHPHPPLQLVCRPFHAHRINDASVSLTSFRITGNRTVTFGPFFAIVAIGLALPDCDPIQSRMNGIFPPATLRIDSVTFTSNTAFAPSDLRNPWCVLDL
jgi:hypothetical protein